MLPPPSPSPPRRHDGARAESGARRRGARGGARGHLHARPARYVGLHPTLTQTLRTNAAPMRSTPRLLRRACALGSNDRNCEKNANRNNGNRLFDSQNNAAGGYACPRAVGGPERGNENGVAPFVNNQRSRMYYYEGSKMVVEWTNQHGCGSNSRVQCNVIIQYACEDSLDPFWAGTASDSWPAPGRPESCPGSPNRYPGVQGGQCFSRNTPENNCMVATPRDGIPDNANDAATDTIPNNANSAVPSDNTRRFGMHESYAYYDLYSRTERNNGLWTADQDVRRRDMRGTRQNPNGNRRGLECPEERDYYPYWAPSPWVDIAILTDHAELDEEEYCVGGGHEDQGGVNMTDDQLAFTLVQTGVRKYCGAGSMCGWYTRNSANTAPKGWCEAVTTEQHKLTHTLWNQRKWPGSKEECEALDGYGTTFQWLEASFSDATRFGWQIPGVVCGKTPFSRVNQLGNAYNGDGDKNLNNNDYFTTATLEETRFNGVNANRYHWKLPLISDPDFLASGVTETDLHDDGLEGCFNSVVLRIRYNDSNADVPSWPAAASAGTFGANAYNAGGRNMVNASDNALRNNEENSPLLQDPYIYMGPGGRNMETDAQPTAAGTESFLSLALNTNQYARTFQDRSYTFSIKKRPGSAAAADADLDTPAIPESMANKVIINVNGRGKRGNIVQTYPAVEYDFVPNQVVCKSGQYLHFQWTGSDYNPRRGCNNGEGGPPDPNNFISNNDNNNARADRMNFVPIEFMTTNVPSNVTGAYVYPTDGSVATDTLRSAHMDAILEYAPCAQAGTESSAELEACFKSMVGLYYLRQDSNPLYQSLRGNRACLTEAELDAISSKNVRETHPRNCAKLNAAIHPYFDGGLVKCSTTSEKILSFFSTRNNNHSNRDQTATILLLPENTDTSVGGSSNNTNWHDQMAFYEETYGTVQSGDTGALTGATIRKSICNDEANAGDGQANNNGASSCIPDSAFTDPDGDVLENETFTVEEGDNDSKGDGNARGCEEIIYFLTSTNTVEQQIMLAIILLFVGGFCAWAGYYLYNRYQKRESAGGLFKFDIGKKWNTKTNQSTRNDVL
uniref:Uncharacterized protein n=1 Tax=Phaeomonas parva TaxID=124430 RepID=A0A7S1TRP3_9STRA